MKRYHFISGIPRSGSTLLSALLRQNPRFHAAMSSPVYSIVNEMLVAISKKSDYSLFLSTQQKKRLLRGVFEAYYEDFQGKEVIFDTRRSWTSKLHLLGELFPDFRIICCVRSVAQVINSFEALVKRSPYELPGIFQYQPELNLVDRAEFFMRPDGHVGEMLNSLKEAIVGQYSDRVLIVQYESLVKNPLGVLDQVYDFIDEPRINHDINNVIYDASEFDMSIGMPGLHNVRKIVGSSELPNILPNYLVKRLEAFDFWHLPDGNPKGVKII